jgi:hypothetical protein
VGDLLGQTVPEIHNHGREVGEKDAALSPVSHSQVAALTAQVLAIRD